MNSRIYEGTVRHTRNTPAHSFQYSLFMLYLDLEELDVVFRSHPLWSTSNPNLAWFRRADYCGDPKDSLLASVKQLIKERTGTTFHGSVRLLTHLRYFGYGMNPVSFYYCFDQEEQLRFIVAEINNTPWNEKHCYVLDASESCSTNDRWLRFQFPKTFHVSPFMDMSLDYDWRFCNPGDTILVTMENFDGPDRIFQASLKLKSCPLRTSQMTRVLCQYPLMTVKVIAGIYWQALRLYLKKSRFYPHPKHQPKEATSGEYILGQRESQDN